MKYLYLFILILYSSLTIIAQQPSHFKLGEYELSDIDIYDIIQDKDEIYWLATNKGVIKYDTYTFKKVASSEMLSTSVFDLQIDYNNIIHFKNLSGQIFKIIEDSCVLRVQLPDSLMSSQVYYTFDNENNIIIATRTVFKVTENNEIEFFKNYREEDRSYAQPFILKDSSVLVHNHAANELHYVKDDKVKSIPLVAKTKDLFLEYFYLNDKLHYCNRKTGEIIINIESVFSTDSNFFPIKNSNEHLRFYAEKSSLWVARQGGGVLVFDKDLNSLLSGNTIFNNSIISSFLKDKAGNILLGTFGDGLIVIPDFNLIEINLLDKNDKVRRITSTNQNDIFLGTQNGRIYKIDSTNKMSLFKDKEFKNIQVLEYIEETDELLVNEKIPTFINLLNENVRQLKFGAIKDVVQIEFNKYLIASNEGVSIFSPNDKDNFRTYFKYFNERTYCVSFNPITKSVYAGTSLGLKIGNLEKASLFTLNNKIVVCSDILYFNQKVFVGTKNNGILVFKDDKLINQWKGENDSYINSIRQLKSFKDNLFLSTSSGLHIINEGGQIIKTLSKPEGLYSNNIIDFEVRNNILWLVTKKGIQKINIDSLKSFSFIPSIVLSEIFVNDSEISIINNSEFSYSQKKFEFHIESNNVNFQEEISYHFRLINIDEKWQVNNYQDNKILYKSLPPGDYKFQVKAKCRNHESKLVSYSFKICPPFWNTWWFYLLVFIIVILIIGLAVYNYILALNRKNAQLLKNREMEKNAIDAQLKALRAQMNPHFIFNSINSIQDLVLQQETIKSYDYLVVFSKLVRNTLDFSEREFIFLKEEITFLETYLSLEKLRFKDDFKYTLTNNVNENLLIPSLIIQPFIENALKHGLLHKEGPKELNINFEVKEQLICEIIDNGVGRRASQQIKKEQNRIYESFSTGAIKQRMEMLSYQYGTKIEYKIIDLKNEGGESSGTRVLIYLPINLNI